MILGAGVVLLLGALLWLNRTQRSRSDAELRRSEGLFRSAFDNALAGMTLIDTQGRYLRANAVFAAMLGRTPEELVGTYFIDQTHPDDAGSDVAAMTQTQSGDAVSLRRAKRYLHADGSTVYVELSTSLVRDSDGQPAHYATQYIDVTARQLAQRERDTRDLMLRAVIANSQSMVYVKDLEGRYLLANEPLQRAFGVTEAELLGHDDNVLDPVLAPVWRANDLRAQREECRFEEWIDAPDGRRFFESVKCPLRDPDGRVYAICGVSVDVTDARRAALEMAAARDAALEATRAKSSFLAMMSHEIRTPMNAVIGMTGLVLDTALDAEQRELLEVVRSSGDSLLTIINDILDFSKIEAGELTLETHPFALRDCVESALALMTLPGHDKGLELVCDVDADCPELLVGDVTRLRQVIVNLVSNAVKFTSSGEVLVSVGTSPSGAGDGEVQLRVAVRDTGIGIPADRLDRLFRSFSQVDASTTREYGGTGLGLAISRRLAQAMGGDLAVTSELGVGSTFTLTAVLGVSADRRQKVAEPVSLDGRSALIVDDNATNRRVLRRQLESRGMVCTDVAGPAVALELVALGAEFDIAVLDMEMPGMDGQQLALELRRLPAGRDLPLVLLSSVQARLEPRQPLFAAVLMKPTRVAMLHHTVGMVLVPAAGMVAAVGTAGGRRAPDGPAVAPPVPLRVLLAEDNLVNQKVAQLMLGQSGHYVDTVGNGLEALQALHRRPYDVVLMDVQMPVLDGLAATRRIRAELAADRQPYVVALTASALTADRKACTAAGADAFLSKPVRQAELDGALLVVPQRAG